MGMKLQNRLEKTAIYFYCGFVLVLTGFPFLFVLSTSFKNQKSYMKSVWSLPTEFYFGNYQRVLQPSFMRYFLNSLIVTTISVTMIILITSLMSYAFAKMHFKMNKPLFLLIIAGMMIPIHTTLIPIYVLTNDLGLYNSLQALIGPYISINIPVSVFILTQFFKEIPTEVEEAAVIDGCGHFKIYRKIIMPLSVPAISTVAIYNGLHTWNEFIYALVLIDSTEKKTLPLGIKDFHGSETVNIPAVMTAILIGSLPVILFYFFAQEKVINGLTQGAVKG